MRISCVTAEQLGAIPLLTMGDAAKIRYKFVLIDDELVYGNIRDHWTLVQWLLCGPLRTRYPLEIATARPLIETQRILTVFGDIMYTGDCKLIVYVAPHLQRPEDIETEVIALLQQQIGA